MAVRSWMAGAAAMILVAGAAQAATLDPDNTSHAASQSTPEVFKNLTGEFEGTVMKLGGDGKLAEFPASASNKTTDGGRCLVSSFESKTNGDVLDGAVMWIAQRSGAASSSWSYEDTPFSASGKTLSRDMKFVGQLASTTSTTQKFEQSVSILNQNHYQVSWHRIEASGQKTLVLHLNLYRMPEGKASTASTKASTSRAIAVAKSALDGVQKTAGVNEP